MDPHTSRDLWGSNSGEIGVGKNTTVISLILTET